LPLGRPAIVTGGKGNGEEGVLAHGARHNLFGVCRTAKAASRSAEHSGETRRSARPAGRVALLPPEPVRRRGFAAAGSWRFDVLCAACKRLLWFSALQ
jgi:hypothetical protein